MQDPRFRAVLRIDPMLRDWPTAAAELSEWGFRVCRGDSSSTVAEARRFLDEWIDRMRGRLPGRQPAAGVPLSGRRAAPWIVLGQAVLEQVVLPDLRRARAALRHDDRFPPAA